MILHTVNQSPQQSNALASCLRIASDNCAILLIEDGVYAAIDTIQTQKVWEFDPEIRSDRKPDRISIKRYVLKEDLDARGLLNKVSDHFTLVDYAGFVDLVAEHHTVQSWF